ncbi:MAG: hypothetical protein KAF91_25900 [Nostoc sp. TH1S01]|nr:hypothetical protein [Nostoc sp. TH1S01]
MAQITQNPLRHREPIKATQAGSFCVSKYRVGLTVLQASENRYICCMVNFRGGGG